MSSTESRDWGNQRPNVHVVPAWSSTMGDRAIELAHVAGLELFPWQQFVVRNILGKRSDGKWAAYDNVVEVGRQNGKGAILETLSLAGLYLLDERFIIHSAHEYSTALSAFNRMRTLIEGTPALSKRLRVGRGGSNGVSNTNGDQGFDLRSGQKLRYRTRTKTGARGLSGDRVIVDEAMYYSTEMDAALGFTTSGRSQLGNPQFIYTGSAVDQWSMPNAEIFARFRARAVAGDNESLGYYGWTAFPEAPNPEAITDAMLDDRDGWARANPSIGELISWEHVARERKKDPRAFAVERLGIGDWPALGDSDARKIDPTSWARLVRPGIGPLDPVVLAFDLSPARDSCAICVAGPASDGHGDHVELVEHGLRPAAAVTAIAGVCEAQGPSRVVCMKGSPAEGMVKPLANLGVTVELLTAAEHAQATGALLDAVDDGSLSHPGGRVLEDAVRGAVARDKGDVWVWSRASSGVDITPLVACTAALWAIGNVEEAAEPRVVVI